MPEIIYNSRVFQSPVPTAVLNRVRGDNARSLMGRMRRHNVTIESLAQKTGLPVAQIKDTVFGNKPPISTRGSWTKEALTIAGTFNVKPEVLFPSALGEIRSAMAMADLEMVPPPEIHNTHNIF